MFFGCHVVVICKVITVAHYRQKQVQVIQMNSSEVFIDDHVSCFEWGQSGKNCGQGRAKSPNGVTGQRRAQPPHPPPDCASACREETELTSVSSQN